MSRKITNDHLFTEDEVDYLLARNEWKLVKANKIQFANKKAPKTQEPQDKPAGVAVKLSKEVVEFVKGLDGVELMKALKKNELSTDGNEKEARFRLATHLQEQKDNDGS